VVSYAGIFTMLYYDAHSGKVYSMDAGYNSYLGETDPLTIPVSDLGILNYGRKPTQGGAKGRETLVPGFMAGVEALHQRFGRLPFRDLFAPAIWYDEHGVRISPVLGWYFGFRAKALARTPEGRRFLRQGGGDFPQVGALFVQTDLAKTLREVAAGGVPAMYTGRWARDFVAIVGREGGKATLEDLRRYRPIWSEPRAEVFFGHTVYANGGPHYGARYLFNGLRRAQALHLEGKGPYWTDAGAFADLAGIVATEGLDDAPHHSNAIVVVDRDGNIAAVTHTINSVIWGDTGIVVDGIPIPDSAGFQQKPLAMLQPGERVPHKIIDAIAFDGRQPVLATASIGSSLIPESIRTLLAVLGQHQSLATVMAAPPFLSPEGLGVPASATAAIPVQIPQGAYRPEFLAELKARSLAVVEVPAPTADGVRGTLAAVAINPATHRRSAADQPGVMVFNRAE
jgi:gamma-glutamyltranspeptidase/glutathione hydrolase